MQYFTPHYITVKLFANAHAPDSLLLITNSCSGEERQHAQQQPKHCRVETGEEREREREV